MKVNIIFCSVFVIVEITLIQLHDELEVEAKQKKILNSNTYYNYNYTKIDKVKVKFKVKLDRFREFYTRTLTL